MQIVQSPAVVRHGLGVQVHHADGGHVPKAGVDVVGHIEPVVHVGLHVVHLDEHPGGQHQVQHDVEHEQEPVEPPGVELHLVAADDDVLVVVIVRREVIALLVGEHEERGHHEELQRKAAVDVVVQQGAVRHLGKLIADDKLVRDRGHEGGVRDAELAGRVVLLL